MASTKAIVCIGKGRNICENRKAIAGKFLLERQKAVFFTGFVYLGRSLWGFVQGIIFLLTNEEKLFPWLGRKSIAKNRYKKFSKKNAA